MPRLPRSTLFPYTTLFRSEEDDVSQLLLRAEVGELATDVAGSDDCDLLAGAHGRALYHDLGLARFANGDGAAAISRSEEHTSELQSQSNLVCRLLLEKKKK